MGWLNNLFGNPASTPNADTRASTPCNPASMHALGMHVLVDLLEWVGEAERRDQIELAHEETGRLVLQMLPWRVEVFDLDVEAGQFLYDHACAREIERDSVFAVGAYRSVDGLFGIFAYSPLVRVPDPSFVPTPPEGVRYDAEADWTRLASLASEQDLAYALPWLKRLYLETYQLLMTSALERSNSIDLARRISVLRDATFMATLERMCERLSDHPQFGAIASIRDAFIHTYADQQREQADLRDNPLVWMAFAAQSPVFTFFKGVQLKAHVAAAMARGDLVADQVEQVRDLVDLATEYLTHDQAREAGIIVDAMIAALPCISDDELAGYLCQTYANFHLKTREPPELERVIDYFKQARERFKNVPTAQAELAFVRANIKRLSVVHAGKREEMLGVKFSPEQQEVLGAYQEHADAGRYEEALACLDSIAGQAEASARVEIESMCGLMLLQLGRVPEAYKRRNRCEHAIHKRPESLPQTGTFEVFCCALLYREGQPRDAAAVAAAALARVEHVCSLSTRMMLAINLSAAQADFDPQAAADTACRYERTASGVDRVYLGANRAGALFALGDVTGAEAKARACLEQLDREGKSGHPALRFSLYARIAQCAAATPADPEARARGLAAVEQASGLLGAASELAKHSLYHTHATLVGAGVDGGGARPVLEKAAAAIEAAFVAVARVEDDIHHQERLISSYRLKLHSFGPLAELFDVYVADRDWQAIMAFAQRFKSRFLNEACFAVSENLCAAGRARDIAQDMQSGGGLALTLELSTKARELDAAAWKGALGAGLRMAGIDQPWDAMVQPFSLEQVGVLLYLTCMQGYSRAAEYAKTLQLPFAAGLLPPQTALLEIVPLHDGVGVVALTGDAQVRWVNRYLLVDAVPSASDAEDGRMAQQARIADALASFKTLGADLQACLPADTAALVICPSSSTWSLPFAALEENGMTLAERYRLVHAPSAVFHSLAAARARTYANTGFAMVDPLHDLQFAAEEIAMLADQRAVAYGAARHWSASSQELRAAAKGKFWLHISAHGSADLDYAGMLSSLNVYAPDDPSGRAGLGLLDILVDPFPGLDCGVAMLSACHAATLSRVTEEPVGVATALLVGGAKAVVAPLWEVDEFATILFFRQLYACLAADGPKLLSQALRDAQMALRHAHAGEVLAELDAILAHRDLPSVRRYRDHIANAIAPDGHPYADPYHWAGFVIVGADVQLP